jgi:hypothetical protein
MKIKIDGTNYIIKCRYEQPVTIAFIKIAGSNAFCSAEAKCNSNDQFSRLRGRKLAIERLIRKVTGDRKERREVWKQILEQMKV